MQEQYTRLDIEVILSLGSWRTNSKQLNFMQHVAGVIRFPATALFPMKSMTRMLTSAATTCPNLKPGFHIIARIVRIVPDVSKNVQTIGTIIWKRYPDDRKRPGRCKIYTIVPIVRIELNSIQAIEVVSVVRVVCDRLGSVSI